MDLFYKSECLLAPRPTVTSLGILATGLTSLTLGLNLRKILRLLLWLVMLAGRFFVLVVINIDAPLGLFIDILGVPDCVKK